MDKLKVSEINLYPVKSCAGISLSSGKIVDTGFEHDREWMIVDDTGNFVTQRQYPKLSLVRVVPIHNGIRFETAGLESIDVPILLNGKRVNTNVWEHACIGIDQGEEISNWLSKFIGKRCHLIRMAPDFKRGVKEKYQTNKKEVVGFADGFPFLLISEESLKDLNSKMDEKLPMNRFRPNIVVSGGNAFQEDLWKKIRIGNTTFRVVKSCARCEITTVDQSTGEKKNEPLETLGTYRTKPKGVMFGRYLVHEGPGVINIGDVIEILE